MTLINQFPVSPFLSGRGTEVTGEPPMPFDSSAEGMRRLRDPFAVNPAAHARPTLTGEEPSGSAAPDRYHPEAMKRTV